MHANTAYNQKDLTQGHTPHFSKIFTRATLLERVLAVIMCLSVHPSGTSQCCTETATCRITQTTQHGSPGTRFPIPKISAKLKRGHPQRRRQMQAG